MICLCYHSPPLSGLEYMDILGKLNIYNAWIVRSRHNREGKQTSWQKKKSVRGHPEMWKHYVALLPETINSWWKCYWEILTLWTGWLHTLVWPDLQVTRALYLSFVTPAAATPGLLGWPLGLTAALLSWWWVELSNWCVYVEWVRERMSVFPRGCTQGW